MQERMQLLGGEVIVEDNQPRGAKLTALLPLKSGVKNEN